MKKKSILFLMIGVIALYSAVYAISAYKGDYQEKANDQAIKAELLAARKAAIGSSAPPVDNVRTISLTRSRNYADRTRAAERQDDEGADDIDFCYSEGRAHASDTFTPGGDEDWYCLEDLCPGVIIKIGVDSHKLGSPTDTFLEVFEDCESDPFACRDDGYGFSGITTDSCVMVTAPDSGKIYFRVINLADICIDPNGGDCTYDLTVEVTSDLETEDNGGCPGEDLLYMPVEADDEDDDGPVIEKKDDGGAVEDLPCLRPDAEGFVAGVIDPAADVDGYNVCLYEGEVLHVNIDAGKCNNECDGELFDPALSLSFYDPDTQDCNPVAVADDTDDLDPGLHYTASVGGLYVIHINDSFGAGSPDDLYYLTANITNGSGDASDLCEDAECFDLSPCPCNGFKNHGGYVVCIVRWAKGLRIAGEITKQQYSDLVSAAAQSDCSQPAYPSGKGDHDGWDGTSKNKDIPKP